MNGAASMPALVRRLRSSSRVAQLQACRLINLLFVGAVAHDSREELLASAQSFAAAGGVEAAVQLLTSGTHALKEAAASMLLCACWYDKQDEGCCTPALVAAGGIPALLAMLQPGGGADRDGVIEQALQTLTRVIEASVAAVQAVLAADGGRVLAQLLWEALERPAGCSWWPGVAQAIVALQCPMGRQSDDSAAALAAHGAIEALVQLLPRPGTGGTTRPAVLRAMRALEALTRGSPAHIAAMVEAGAVPALVRCLSHSEPAVQADAARLLKNLLNSCPRLAADLVEAGGDRQLQRLHASSDDWVRQQAGDALASLAAACKMEDAAGQPGGAATMTGTAPSTAAAPARTPRVCAAPVCGATSGLKRCGGCGTVRYCSTECSRAHWREHRAECRRLQAERAAATAAGATDPPTAVL